ncbi:EamA family transporter [Priestia megaterium]|uniref:EamA family transporter n=2 Tax=Priestia megaterium TaxID=1404 RepID=UPI000BF7CF07|nr:hypothetical protein CN395_29410 [Priestia megaterium]
MMMSGSGAETANLVGSAFIIISATTNALYNVLAIGNHVIEGTTGEFFQPFSNIKFLLAILYLGILSSLGTSYLSNYALSKIAAAQMSVFSNVATLITIIAGVLFLNEAFHFYRLICFSWWL